MTLPYLPRLVCLSLAAFALVHVALALVVSLLARTAVQFAEGLRPAAAARLLLILRLLPAAGAAFVVMAVCLPSYLWLEPDAPAERVGFACVAAALLAVAIWSVSLVRGLRAASGSRRFLQTCRRAGRPTHLPDEPAETFVVDSPAPVLALAGILHPRLIVSRGVLSALTPEQLAAALRHERAHWTSRDNLKRFCILLTPGSNRTLEHGWRKFTEWAADDRAVAGSPRRSLALADALVRVARMTGHIAGPPLATPLMGDADNLMARVERLLRPAPVKRHSRPFLVLSAASLIACAVGILQPAVLYSVHQALERLVE